MTPLPARRDAERRGRWAEHLCRVSLIVRGWRIVAARKTHGRGSGAGEIDLIARRGRTLVFIEVKARPSVTEALESVTPAQRQRIAAAAAVFLAASPQLAALSVRFDVMAVTPWRWPVHIADAWRP